MIGKISCLNYQQKNLQNKKGASPISFFATYKIGDIHNVLRNNHQKRLTLNKSV